MSKERDVAAVEALRRKALDAGSTEEEQRTSAVQCLRLAERAGLRFSDDGASANGRPDLRQGVEAAERVGSVVNETLSNLADLFGSKKRKKRRK